MSKSHEDAIYRLKMILAYLRACSLFSDTLDLYIRKSGIVQKELAKELFVDPAAIIHWRKNRRIPKDSDTIFKLSRALSLSPKEKQTLLLAWSINRGFNGLIPYVAVAIEEGDETDMIIESVVYYLQSAFETLERF